MTSPADPGSRLERALEVFFAARVATPADGDRLLDAHPDLRELLEPAWRGARKRSPLIQGSMRLAS